MSLIIAYVGKKGCVMASDKRRIAYFGSQANRDALEKELYEGEIKTDEELYERANDLKVSIKITDDANKLRTIEDVVVGEVSSKGSFETKRKRIYGTTMGYQIIEMIGSEIVSREKHEKAIILFGNNITKSLAERQISKKWKPSISLKYMGDIFEEILREVSNQTPSIGKEFDVMIKQPEFTAESSQEYLDEVVDRDVKLLIKFRQKLEEDLLEQQKTIELASKIITNGDIGLVTHIDNHVLTVTLNSNVQAFDSNWKQLAKSNDQVVMISENEDVNIGDKVIIENEKLCLERNKANLKCDIILCST
ncbi:DUF2121 domain-containing protein [Methanobrevibacter sp. OttesenSCG-928-K11]|nr:DUF2121 domain-containing protein [Methanobrevibacter sp. OttesenSCG-928-K11]MDL2270878.1 DUF2121 domain-containing protein [Methanobrevibacter sp. OttesenSCG-928-I08]